jgi:uroporphyrin-III C-methyltransferase/precorrin-2 dehydrogenase/sirohydrochlorin ferrochelatase
MATTPLYPLFARLDGRDVLVVGGGDVAERKVRALLATGARVSVGAPSLTATLARWRDAGAIGHLDGPFDDAWLDGQWLAVAATDDDGVNRAVADAAGRRRMFVNVVDDERLSTFHVPAVIDRAPLQIAISSAGAAPMLARWIRERLESLLDPALGPFAQLLSRARARIRARFPRLPERRGFYTRAIESAILDALGRGRAAEAQRTLDELIASPSAPVPGKVFLVGAGPGDPGLLTLRALRELNRADVILHDRLVAPEVLELARRDALRIETGKQAGNHAFTQERIHELMLEHARAGRRVVRLKGGDPFVFGRGGEEMEFLRAHGIGCEIVPGITAALACAAYAGVPLTHRDHAQSVRLITAHTRDSIDRLDWRALAARHQTLAVYMGIAQLDATRARLRAAGLPATTPVAAIENGTRPEQRVIVTTLGAMAGLADRHALASPALLIIGSVAGLAADHAWFGSDPIIDPAIARPAQLARTAA